jgi:tellurite resistance protein
MSQAGGEGDAIMRYSFLVAFANDGTVDADELAFIKRLALRDGIVDAREREVLSQIFSRVSEAGAGPEVWREIQEFKREHGIP